MLYIKDNFDIHEFMNLTKYNGIGIVLSRNKYLIWLTHTFNKNKKLIHIFSLKAKMLFLCILLKVNKIRCVIFLKEISI